MKLISITVLTETVIEKKINVSDSPLNKRDWEGTLKFQRHSSHHFMGDDVNRASEEISTTMVFKVIVGIT
jgi:hypothetical protein